MGHTSFKTYLSNGADRSSVLLGHTWHLTDLQSNDNATRLDLQIVSVNWREFCNLNPKF